VSAAQARSFRRVLPDNPFVGLRPFESTESLLFFGRRDQTLELMEKLHQTRFVAVVGSSGCGKSSLIRAGLIPGLKAGFLVHDLDRWKIAIMKPGETPLYTLAAALTEDGGHAATESLLAKIREDGLEAVIAHIRETAPDANFLLLVDQFEEIFRSLKKDATARQIDDATDFVSMMLRLTTQTDVPACVVMSMRTDFLGDCDVFFGLPEALNQSQYLVPRLTRQQRREVVEGPIGLYQRSIKPELVDTLLNDAGERSDQLPILQHALMRTWSQFNGEGAEEVELRHYEACGGIAGALNRHVEQAMDGMTPEQEAVTERMFRVLTDTDDHGRQIRRPQLLSELVKITGADRDRILEVVERFSGEGRSFLVRSVTEDPEDPRIDISHESLFRQWKRLGEWVEAEGQSKEEYLHLAQAARLFKKGKEGLMRDPALRVAEQWKTREGPSAEWAARYEGDFAGVIQYLDNSVNQREREILRRRAYKLGGVGALILLAVGWSAYSWIQARDAGQAVRFAAALGDPDPLVRALVVAELKKSSVVNSSLPAVQQVATSRIPIAVLGERDNTSNHASAAVGAWFDASGDSVMMLSTPAAVRRWPSSGNGDAVEVAIDGLSGKATAVAVSADRRWTAIGFGNGGMRIIRENQPSYTWPIDRDENEVTAVAFAPGSQRILAAYANYIVRVCDLRGVCDTSLGKPTAHTGVVSAVQFDGQGKHALTASWDGTARLWDVAAGKLLNVFDGDFGPIYAAAISADGKWIMCGYSDNSVRVWRADGKGQPLKLEGHTAPISSVAITADRFRPKNGFVALTASADLTARVWDLRVDTLNGQERVVSTGVPAILRGHTRPVKIASFNSDGSKIITASDDGTVRVWMTESVEPVVLGKHTRGVQSLAVSPGYGKVATASDDGTAGVWSLDGSAPPKFYRASTEGSVRSVAFNRSGTKVVAGADNGTFYIWDLATDLKRMRAEADGDVLSVGFTPDDKRILTGTSANVVQSWPVTEESEPPTTLATLKGWVWHASYSPDGAQLLTASAEGSAQVWNVAGDSKLFPVTTLQGTSPVLDAAFSPDGTRVATATSDGFARLWAWNSKTPALLREFQHGAEVWSVLFGADGKSLITGSLDGTAKIWNTGSGNALLTLIHPTGLRTAAFVAAGDSRVATGAEDGSLRLWRTTLPDLLSYLSSASSACLTSKERVRFLAESEEEAKRAYESCENIHHRTHH